MPDPTTCHFWDPQSGSGKLAHSRCEQNASTFVRVRHTGRLCPLCPSCLRTFESASRTMPAEAKKGVPGNGEYDVVELDAGREEYARQPKKG